MWKRNWNTYLLVCIYTIHTILSVVCIWASSIKITAGLAKWETEREWERESEREEVKLKCPGRTAGHRPVWHHVYSHLWAGAVCSRIRFVSLQETLCTKPLQELHKGLVVAAFPAPPKISQQSKLGHPGAAGRPQTACPQGSSVLGKFLK